MKKLILCVYLCVLCIFLLGTASAEEKSPDAYWAEIRAIAAKDFGGSDMELILDVGYNNEFDGVAGAFKIPIFSKQQKLARRERALLFLKDGAELTHKLQASSSVLKIKKQHADWLKQRMQENDDLDAAEKFFAKVEEIATHESQVKMVRRQLESLINPYRKLPADSDALEAKHNEGWKSYLVNLRK